MISKCGYGLESALILLKNKHNNISINPGFLCQLYLIANEKIFPIEYHILKFSSNIKRKNNSNSMICSESEIHTHLDAIISSTEIYSCKKCRTLLGSENDVLFNKCPPNQFESLPTLVIDPFWQTYQSPYQYLNSKSNSKNSNMISMSTTIVSNIPTSGYRIMKPLPWITKQIQSNLNMGILLCENCKSKCGLWKCNSLLLCNNYLLGYLFILEEEKILIRVKNK